MVNCVGRCSMLWYFDRWWILCGIAFEKCRLHVYPREVYHPAFGEYVSIHSLFKCAVCIWDLSMHTQQFWYAACSKCVSCKGSQTQIHPFLYAQSSLDIAPGEGNPVKPELTESSELCGDLPIDCQQNASSLHARAVWRQSATLASILSLRIRQD